MFNLYIQILIFLFILPL